VGHTRVNLPLFYLMARPFVTRLGRERVEGKRQAHMKKIEAIIRPLRLEAVKSALVEAGVEGMTASDVRGAGRAGGARHDIFRGEQYVMHLPPKVKLELTVRDSDVEEVIALILEQARTGEEGDGKVFVLPVADARRIRTGETGDEAV
jgi:nitrogen regulatory protein P-II 1